MNITTRLKMMSFMQYFIWGSWLVTLGAYMINTLHFTGSDVGMIYSSKALPRSLCLRWWESLPTNGYGQTAPTSFATSSVPPHSVTPRR